MDIRWASLIKRTIKSISLLCFCVGLIFVMNQLMMARIMDETETVKMESLHGVVHNRDIISLKRSRIQADPEFFLCGDGLSISTSKINDDYCDCKDGSDEPDTSACSGVSYFECRYRFKKYRIPSSWVNDTVCDCCDGSDEFNGNHRLIDLSVDAQKKIGQYLTPCPNTCTE